MKDPSKIELMKVTLLVNLQNFISDLVKLARRIETRFAKVAYIMNI